MEMALQFLPVAARQNFRRGIYAQLYLVVAEFNRPDLDRGWSVMRSMILAGSAARLAAIDTVWNRLIIVESRQCFPSTMDELIDAIMQN